MKRVLQVVLVHDSLCNCYDSIVTFTGHQRKQIYEIRKYMISHETGELMAYHALNNSIIFFYSSHKSNKRVPRASNGDVERSVEQNTT